MTENEPVLRLIKYKPKIGKKMKNKNHINTLLLTAVFFVVGLACSQYGEKIEYGGNSEVYYTKNVSETEARKLGDWLKKNEFFTGDNKKTLQLDKSGGTYQVRFVIKEEKINDPQTEDTFRIITRGMSEEIFGGAPTETHFCNDRLQTQKIIKP